jgi:hypothetical protein
MAKRKKAKKTAAHKAPQSMNDTKPISNTTPDVQSETKSLNVEQQPEKQVDQPRFGRFEKVNVKIGSVTFQGSFINYSQYVDGYGIVIINGHPDNISVKIEDITHV